jgi:hypothetical protein
VKNAYDRFVPTNHQDPNFWHFAEFASALWEEGWPPLEDLAIRAIVASQERAAAAAMAVGGIRAPLTRWAGTEADSSRSKAITQGAVDPLITDAVKDAEIRGARQIEAAEDKRTPSLSGGGLVGAPEDRLSSFMQEHPGTTLADIKYSGNVFTAEFQDWRRGKLKSGSVMSGRIEDVLSGVTPLKKKPRKPRLE